MPSSAFRTGEINHLFSGSLDFRSHLIFPLISAIATQRKIIGHVPPAFVRHERPWFFITICCQYRGKNQLCVPRRSSTLLNDAIFYHTTHRWILNLLLLMPDHLHLIAAFPPGREMSMVIGNWKRLTALSTGISWQKNYFDHRIRANESLEQKIEYIRQNPVRAGLAKCPDEWPHFVDQTNILTGR